jgi:7,8-dihydroneopterin aldolase/epimerase/oxygenase
MKIQLHDMVFYGFHGVHDAERSLGQRFIVTYTAVTDSNKDSKIHNLEDTLDYTKVYAVIKDIMEQQQYHLLENCANRILDRTLESFPEIMQATVSIKKPSVPIQGTLEYVDVEMVRNR